jgi:hypothetical protein
MHRLLTRLAAYWDFGAVAVLAAAWFAVLFHFALPLQAFRDEMDVIVPAAGYIGGAITEAVKYPSFSFYFYGSILKLTGALSNMTAAVIVSRLANYLVFILNVFLFHAYLRRFFGKGWALAGTVLFTSLPVVVFSAVYVKTEGLVLAELLAALLVAERLDAAPTRRRWYALAGLFAALGISTKLSPLPLFVFAAAVAELRRRGVRVTPREWKAFGAVFTAALLATWTNLWIFDRVVALWRNDVYFFPGAGPFNAVTEGLIAGFPYGRFSSFVTATMPMALGVTGLFFAGALAARTIPSRMLRVFGAASLAALAIALATTRMRLPHGFTPNLIFFLAAGVSFLAWLGAREPGTHPVLNATLAKLLVALALAQTVWQATGLPAFADGIAQVASTVQEKYKGPFSTKFFLYWWPNQFDRTAASVPRPFAQMKDVESLREYVNQGSPDELYIFQSYIDNACKYAINPTYRDNCDYFYQELLGGTTPYYVWRRDDIPWTGFFFLDPEFRHMSFYLFRKKH